MKLLNISILIPTLNSKKTIRECLEGIVAQEYPRGNLEVIIADGGSTDGTLEIIREIGSKNLLNLKVLHNTLKTGDAGKASQA